MRTRTIGGWYYWLFSVQTKRKQVPSVGQNLVGVLDGRVVRLGFSRRHAVRSWRRNKVLTNGVPVPLAIAVFNKETTIKLHASKRTWSISSLTAKSSIHVGALFLIEDSQEVVGDLVDVNETGAQGVVEGSQQDVQFAVLVQVGEHHVETATSRVVDADGPDLLVTTQYDSSHRKRKK